MAKIRFTALEKYELIQEFLQSGQSREAFQREHHLYNMSIKRWLYLYNRYGFDGFKQPNRFQRYDAAFKRKVVQAYLQGAGSETELAIKFGLRSSTQVHNWISKYNGNKVPHRSGGGYKRRIPMTSRKLTFEDRVTITTFAIENNRNYRQTAEKFNVSYQQVRSWVLKVDQNGFEALRDSRGRKKSEDELSEMDKVLLENKRLKAELKAKEAQAIFAKKFQENLRKGRH